MGVRILATGLAFPEGPCIDRSGALFVVELANHCVSRVHDGSREPWVDLGGSPNGAAFGPLGDLYVCNGGGQWPAFPSTGGMPGPGGEPGLIQRISSDGTASTLIADIEGRRLNSPNDICFDDRGAFYFTDPVWKSPDGVDGARIGDICYATTGGDAARIQTGIRFPNGLHVTPDGTALLVGETDTGLIHRFPILAPGGLGRPDLYADVGSGSGPDGMCFDVTGRLIVAASGAGCLFVVPPGGGSVERVIESDDPCPTNVCFGGPGYRTLFVTEGGLGRVVSLDWEVPGMVLFPDRPQAATHIEAHL